MIGSAAVTKVVELDETYGVSRKAGAALLWGLDALAGAASKVVATAPAPTASAPEPTASVSKHD